jgi:hypothetical protein
MFRKIMAVDTQYTHCVGRKQALFKQAVMCAVVINVL